MKQKILGVIGGLGHETGCNFCLNVNKKFKPLTKRQPHILLDNLPISQEAEERLINGGPSKEHLDLLMESVQRLNKLNVSVIVIVCNTVHIFIDELRRLSKIPILSIIEETANKCKDMNFMKVGIIGSTKTVESGIHSKKLKKLGIDVVIPNQIDQRFVSECIVRIINNTINDDDKEKMIKIIKTLEKEGAQAIILGCTDLPLLISKFKSNVPIINTMELLENAAVSSLLGES